MTFDTHRLVAIVANRVDYVAAAIILNVNLNAAVRIAARHGVLEPQLKSHITDVNYAFKYIMLAATTLDLLRYGVGFFGLVGGQTEMSVLTLLSTSPIGLLAMDHISLTKILLAVLSALTVTWAVKGYKHYFGRGSIDDKSSLMAM